MPVFTIPAPVDGLNLRDPNFRLQPTEARDLTGYYVHDFGIREGGNFEEMPNGGSYNVTTFIPYNTVGGSARMLASCANNKIYKLTSTDFSTASDVTGVLTLTNSNLTYSYFNGKMFFLNNADVGFVWDIATETLANDGWTGLSPNSSSLVQSWNYKSRFYAVIGNSGSYCYGGIGSVAGALTTVDNSPVFSEFNTILFGTSWTANQGNQNEDLMVLVGKYGEVLIYSGDYPGASNWSLISRVKIPKPKGVRGYINIGQDVLISTERGVVSLRSIIATASVGEPYFEVSNKLGEFFQVSPERPIQDPRGPFIYYSTTGSYNSNYIYVLNYERGAWSRFVLPSGVTSVPSMAFFDTGTPRKYLLATAGFTGDNFRLDDYTIGNDLNYTPSINHLHRWSTGYSELGAPRKDKQINWVQVTGRGMGQSATLDVTVTDYADFDQTNAPDTRSSDLAVTTPGLPTEYQMVDLTPPGLGVKHSLVFKKTTTSATVSSNELAEVVVDYEITESV